MKKKMDQKVKRWALCFRTANAYSNKTDFNVSAESICANYPDFPTSSSRGVSARTGVTSHQKSCAVQKVLLMTHGAGYWEDRGYHHLVGSKKDWSKRQRSGCQCSRTYQYRLHDTSDEDLEILWAEPEWVVALPLQYFPISADLQLLA